MSTTQRNYKVIYDPELDSSPIKQTLTLKYETTHDTPKDPRPSKTDYEKKSRLYKTLFYLIDFDKKNIEHDKKTVLLSNISPLSTESQIITILSVYGTVNRVEIIKDPLTGGPLGCVKVSFVDESSALQAIANGHGRRVIISDSMKIEYDLTGEKLQAALSPVEKTPDKQEDYIPRSYSSRNSIISLGEESKVRKKPTRWGVSTPNEGVSKVSLVPKEKENTSLPIREPYFKTIILKKHLPYVQGGLDELAKLLSPFGYIDITYDDDWIILFESKQNAMKAQKYIQETNQKILGYPIELTLETSQPIQYVLFQELAEIFLKDIKNRIASPSIYDFFKAHSSKDSLKKPIKSPLDQLLKPRLEKTEGSSDPMRRSSSSEDDYLGPKNKTNQRIKNKRLDDSDSSDLERTYRRVRSKRKRMGQVKTMKGRKSSKSSVNRVMDESIDRQLNKAWVEVDIDGEEEGEEEEEEEEEERMDPERLIQYKINQMEYDQSIVDKLLSDLDDSEEEEEISDSLNKEWDPFYQTRDVEDLEYLRIAIVERTEGSDQIVDALGKLEKNDKKLSQSARTRGYYPIPNAVKATYLHKNKPIVDIESDFKKRQRRWIMVMQNKTTHEESDVIEFRKLLDQPKLLVLKKSPIHEWGLFTEEKIKGNTMVIEYRGEVIRQQVAIERENERSTGYLFRVDEDTMIDATKKGSIARFINHCCVPNCSAKIIIVNKQKKIIIYANRDIEPGEEITFDYKFPIEKEKIPCLCGSKFCKGTLN